MSQFLSKTIQSIFCQYDDNYISPSVKRFLSECIIQLINVSLSSINNNQQEPKNEQLMLFNNNGNQNKQKQLNSYSKQMSLLTEWLENFIEPSHISMFTRTIIHIIRQLQGAVTYNKKDHNHRMRPRQSVSRQSLSTTQNDHDSIDFAITPETEQAQMPKKFQRISLFNKTSSNHMEDDEKYVKQRTSFTPNSQASELIINTSSTQPLQAQQSGNSESAHDAPSMDLDWHKYEEMSYILIRSLTKILNQSLKRYNYKITVIFDDQFDKIIDEVIEFLFSRLTLSYSDKFRGIIGDCLGLISRKYLKKICKRTLKRWDKFEAAKKQKTNDIKRFAILHRAVKYLEFDIYGRNREAAIDYLTQLCIRMQRTEKKVLRQQICHSLLYIFDSISPQKEEEDACEKVDEEEDTKEETANKPFIRLCPKETDSEFWTLYYTIFNIVEQWSHKKGCTIFCYQLIIKMMCCGNLPFYLHVLKYQPNSKSGYILPSLHRNNRNKSTPKMIADHHNNNSHHDTIASQSPNSATSSGAISALPDNPSKSPIIKFLISNLSNDNTKSDTLSIILLFIQELPEEFVLADNEWYAKLLKYLEEKIIHNSNPEQSQELKIIAAIFTAFAERDGKSYFVPAVQRLLLGNNWLNRIGLETLHRAVVVFGHSLSRYNFTLGACLSPFVRGTKGHHFQQLALQCWPIIRSPRERVEDIHNEVMQMVQLIKNKQFARLAADNLINYVEIDFENHLIPVVSSLLSPMRDFDRFKEEHLKITIEVLSQIIHRLIKHLEEYEEYEYLSYYYAQKGTSRTQNLSDSEYDEFEEKSHEFGSMNNTIDADENLNVNRKQLPIPMTNLDSMRQDQSVEYDDANQEFYRVKNALSLHQMWPHIRLLIEGYVLLWYLHPDEYIRDQLYELLSVIRHSRIINIIDPRDGPCGPSIYEQIQRYQSRHHKNDGYSNSGNVNMGTNTSSAASQSGLSNHSNERNDTSVPNVKPQSHLNSSLPQRHAVDDERYQIQHQFPPELERLIFKKRKFFEGLLNWVFLRTTPQLDTFFNQISSNLGIGEDVCSELYDNDEFVLMKHRWELMCLSVRIDETYYQQTNDDKYIASFHRARSSSFDKYKYNNGYTIGASSPHKRYITQSSTHSSHHNKASVIVPHHATKGREVSQSNTVVINTTVAKLQHRVFNTEDNLRHHTQQDTTSTTIHHKQDTTASIDVDTKKASKDLPNISVGNDLEVQDLREMIKFSRAMQMTPTKTDLQSAKNKLRLIGRPSARREKELDTINDDDANKENKKEKKFTVKTDKLKTTNTPSTKARSRIPSTSKESDNNPNEMEIDVKSSTLGGPSPNGSPLPAPLMQGDSGIEESHSVERIVEEDEDEYADDEEMKWNESEHEEEEKGDVVGPLLKDKKNKKKPTEEALPPQKESNKRKHQQVHYSEDVHYALNPQDVSHDEDESENDENIYNYHREQISMFLVPMTDIRIPKRMLNQFLDKIISFTLKIQSIHDDEVLDSIFEPIQRMDVVVSELLIERLFRTAFSSEHTHQQLPQSTNDSDYNEWKRSRLKHFYFHGPTLHLLSVIYTNRGIINHDYSSTTFHHPSNEFAISLDKIIIATIYLVEIDELNTLRSYEVVLYLLILMRQFFYFYRNEEAKFQYDPFLDIPGVKNETTNRVLLMKKPRPLSNMKMRRNLLDFIQSHMSIIPEKISKEIKKLEDKHLPINLRLHQRNKHHHKHHNVRFRADEKVADEDADRDHIVNNPEYKRLIYLYASIERALAECILGLIELGPIGEKTLEMELLKELEKYICHNNDRDHDGSDAKSKLKYIAQKGMNAVFKHNSHLLEHFIQQSCKLHLYYNEFVVGSQNTIQTADTRHRHNRNDKNITLISLAYLTSLVHNFQSADMIGLNPISALVLCMLHQCSPHQQARNLALKLAKCMANLKKDRKNKFNYDPGAKFLFETTTSSPDKYLKYAFDYSHRISKLRPEIVPQIMFEVVRFYDRVESEYDREILLRLLPPWISQFSTVTNKISANEITSCKEMTYAFIVKLYELTNKASKSPNQSSKQLTLSYRLWHCLALSTPDESHFDKFDGDKCKKYNKMLISEIVSYIIQRYTLHYVEESVICEKILEKICIECYKRKEQEKLLLLAQCLGESLHRYPDKFPLEPELFIRYKQTQLTSTDRNGNKKKYKKDIIKSTEQSAFKLIHRLLDCKIIEPFKKYIPLLLQNAAVINKNTFDDIVLRLAKYFQIDKRSKRSRTRSRHHNKKKSRRKYSKRRRKRTEEREQQQSLLSLDGMEVDKDMVLTTEDDDDDEEEVDENEQEASQFEGISFWKKYNPKMCRLWSDLAISWALQANKPHITMYSVEVFDALNSYTLNYDLLVQLSLITYHCIKQGNYPTALFTIIIKILQKSLTHQWEKDQYRIALSLAYILLSLQHESIHKAALTFWNKFFDLNKSDLQHNIIGSMHRVLSFNSPAIDSVIAQQLQHSLAREELFDLSVTMLEKLCCLLSHQIPAKKNQLLHLTVLSHMLKIQIEFKSNIRAANCDRLIYILSHYKRETAEMIEQCKNIQLYKNFTEFLTDCCQTYFKLFPHPSVFRGGLSTLCKFIEYGSKLWYVSVLNIIDIILNVTQSVDNLLIDSSQFKQISNVLILASYLSPIRCEKRKLYDTESSAKKAPQSMRKSKKDKSGEIKKDKKEDDDKQEEDDDEEYENINLTPLVSRIALKLTKRKQLRLPQDRNFLFQFIDPLPESIDRIWKEIQQIEFMEQRNKRIYAKTINSNNNKKRKRKHIKQSTTFNLNKRLVLTMEEEKQCEEATVKRLKEFLLPMLTKTIKGNHASRHMRSGSILNFGASSGVLASFSATKKSATNPAIEKEKEKKNKHISRPDATYSHTKMKSNVSYQSVVIQQSPSVDPNDTDENRTIPDLFGRISEEPEQTPQPTKYAAGRALNEEEEEEDDEDSASFRINTFADLDQVHEEDEDEEDSDQEEEEEESKHVEYHGDDDVDGIDDVDFVELDEDALISNLEHTQTVHVHKQHSTKDYGQFGFGDEAKEIKEKEQKNTKKQKKSHKQLNDTFLIKVEEVPSKVGRKKKKKHHGKNNSNSNNSVIEF